VKSTQVQANAERLSGLSGRPPLSWIITAAKAQDAAPTGAPQSNGNILRYKTSGFDCPTCTIQFKVGSGATLETQPLDSASGGFVDVPNNASTAVIAGAPGSNAAEFKLDDFKQNDKALEVYRNCNYWNDFQHTLGNQGIKPYDLEIKAMQEP
jgi:hypothetical protein